MRQRIEKMLDADRDSNPDWQVSALEAVARRRNEPVPDMAWRTFGRYRTTERIGSGGMGVVYKAVREDDEYQQTVAIKILRGGIDTPDRVARFQHERQIMAHLVHPNIARLLDGGTTEEGLPYFVLEFIDGVPLNKYAEQAAPSIEEKLRLFQHVADAVQFAHRNLVVHCDLKPANILVQADGTPKLLDFGIAKVLDDVLLSKAATAPLMTPQYASPEQVLGGPITTASDIYSLGVLLCVFLTGRKPYAIESEKPADVQRAVCEQPVDTRDLPGELANIVAMATRKESDRRYSSVEQFSADIERYLSHRPVIARGDTLTYRVRKYVRRNRMVLAVASIAVIAISVGLTVSLLQSRRAARRFEEIRDLAHFLIFDTYDGMSRLPGSTPLRKSVVAKAQEYLDRLARDADSDPSLNAEIADSYLRLGMVQGYPYQANLGDTKGALASVEKARMLLEGLVNKYPDRRQYVAALAVVYRRQGMILSRARKPEESIAAALHAVSILENAKYPKDGQSWLDLAAAQESVGIVEDWRASRWPDRYGFASTREWFQKAKDSLERTPKDTEGRSRMVVIAYANLGDTERNWGDHIAVSNAGGSTAHYEAALLNTGAAIAELRRLPTGDAESQRDIADCQISLARALGGMNRFAEAEASYAEALLFFEKATVAQPDNQEVLQDLATLYHYRGETFARAGKTGEANRWTALAIPIFQSVLRHDPENEEAAELLDKAKKRLSYN